MCFLGKVLLSKDVLERSLSRAIASSIWDMMFLMLVSYSRLIVGVRWCLIDSVLIVV